MHVQFLSRHDYLTSQKNKAMAHSNEWWTEKALYWNRYKLHPYLTIYIRHRMEEDKSHLFFLFENNWDIFLDPKQTLILLSSSNLYDAWVLIISDRFKSNWGSTTYFLASPLSEKFWDTKQSILIRMQGIVQNTSSMLKGSYSITLKILKLSNWKKKSIENCKIYESPPKRCWI